MPIRLRPHHLLCILTFAGHGYSRTFSANFAEIVERLRGGENVELVSGPDDICAPHCNEVGEAHCRTESVTHRDEAARLALADIPELAPLFVTAGSIRLDPSIIADLRRRFASGVIRGACNGCEWSPLCSDIAADAFSAARL